MTTLEGCSKIWHHIYDRHNDCNAFKVQATGDNRGNVPSTIKIVYIFQIGVKVFASFILVFVECLSSNLSYKIYSVKTTPL